ncbi:DUF2271 domain-containing protein [Clostridium sp. P21]|uniref:DUF2271 domain-containing protein n=1 Tax=Clostridium muellerianum TaxID=2716538 RepID=A0A7Y0EJX6_9CLOT|nr:DUF2271 domain-containing protein [Clostridium muellerianum]NMM64747.1 DUF2271 domain-containing protein [Clostridium muellerianum]
MKKRIMFLVVTFVIIVFAVYKIIDTIKLSRTSNISIVSEKQGKKLSVSVVKGEEYLHKFQVNSLINIKTPPQFAIWIEDLNGNYVDTIYATSKIVNQNWSKDPNNSAQGGKIERKEALPYWMYKRGNNKINPDIVSSATPKGSSIISNKINEKQGGYIIFMEVNMSTDFNEYYPKNVEKGKDNYSGGPWGSGQPALIYSSNINLNSTNKIYDLKLIGHSSPDGSDGNLYKDLSKVTTAKSIINKITVEIK